MVFEGGWNLSENWNEGGWGKIDSITIILSRIYMVIFIVSIVISVVVAFFATVFVAKAVA
jgi:hypothetical protein